MHILMLGWEFPPHSIGGLGRHTYELLRAMSKKNLIISIILPFSDYKVIPGIKFLSVSLIKSSSVYNFIKNPSTLSLYGELSTEVEEYAKKSIELATAESFDLIHANDWITGRAGVEIKRRFGKPLLMTVHSTEYDRTLGHPQYWIEQEERNAILNADRIITVSERLRQQLIKNYGVSAEKIGVIHNAIDISKFYGNLKMRDPKMILYVGRLSLQKGVDHLLKAFKIVAENDKDVMLYITGEGPQLKDLIDLSIDLKLGDRVVFTGKISDEAMKQLYSKTSVFVMPSVSEPFGITALEAVASMAPTIISIQSGVSEILKNVFKVDFWDIRQMADMIIGLLQYPAIKEQMSSQAYTELATATWEAASDKFIEVYKRLIGDLT
jgi:glycosyltransferase involved in cell wall biosynthesis